MHSGSREEIKSMYFNNVDRIFLEDIIEKIGKYYRGLSDTFAILTCLAVNHAISFARMPVASSRLFVALDSSFSHEKSFIIRTFAKYMIPENWYAHLYKPSVEEIVFLFWPKKGVVKPPILILEDFDYSFIKNPAGIHSFISAVYDDIPWWFYSEKTNSIVPVDVSGISLLADISRKIFCESSLLLDDEIHKHFLVDIFSRMVIVRGRVNLDSLLRAPDELKIIRSIIGWISEHPYMFLRFEFEHTSVKKEVLDFCEEKISENRDDTFIMSAVSRLYEHVIKIAVAHAACRLDNTVDDNDIDFAIDIIDRILPIKIKMIRDILFIIAREYGEKILINRLVRIMKKFRQPIRLREIYRRLGITKEETKILLKKVYGEKVRYVYDGRSCLVCCKIGSEDCLSCRYRLQCVDRKDIVKKLLRQHF